MESSLIGLLGAVIAASVAWIVPMRLRKEKFKEVLYGRLLAVYDDLLAQVPHLLYLFAAAKHADSEADRLLHSQQLVHGLVKFKRTLEGASHLLPEQFQMTATLLYESLFADQKNGAVVRPETALGLWIEAIDMVREHLAVEKLSQEIAATLRANHYPQG